MSAYPNRSVRDGFSAIARMQKNVSRMVCAASTPSRTQSFQTTAKVADAYTLAVAASDDAAEALDYAGLALEAVEGLATVASTGDYADLINRPTNLSDFTNDTSFITAETDPTVPAWAKQPTKPTYTASEVGAIATGTVYLPVGSVLLMSSNTNPSTLGALGTWAFRRAVQFPLSGDTNYFLFERTA